jgi:hypothetical protein
MILLSFVLESIIQIILTMRRVQRWITYQLRKLQRNFIFHREEYRFYAIKAESKEQKWSAVSG